ncbi:glycerol-3-phosphate dehydrogenase [NAD(P)+] [bacterium BMS3Abin07]|nr:glycerol-3-phosphate dehydrogenase [NAD(P)+] [bacterium BMS3Abin07]GBE32515.1 glycerol-3-phosphate dehydrogenase [NAD(P)+] [bacterium BMS3Bbin05]HDL19839.1 NAD(P)-dependent glycerol-3-phosphate dehydrogenase [Nitrospirota bacterium]HDO23418.1 NAD(P)-dependent glycerol-3-phosphate dehydrogenase [Nitrospirota bacterium]HDZ87818.1 NAD(P)-dependent glycerol-3-phosphate dehydrogenase [Nitrospirota bacterium]
MSYITVIGAGSWGTTLAILLSKKDYDVTLWAFEEDLAEYMKEHRVNKVYMPDIELPDNLNITHSFEDCLPKARYVVSVVPTQFVRGVFSSAAQFLKDDAIIVSASKGIEKGSLKTVSEILGELIKNRIAAISGPSFAKEVVKEIPTAVTLATKDTQVSYLLQEIFNTEYFRVYTHHDVKGVEIGGALKNVIAIASGICEGLGLGQNARAALITRGIAEMLRLGIKLGADPWTFSGLSGMGDMILTCTSTTSRNYSVGVKLGQGMTLSEIVGATKSIAEGVETSVSAYELSKRHQVEMPIVEQVYHVLHRGKDPLTAVRELMNRPLKTEFDHF